MELEHILASLADGARQALQADAAVVRLLDERRAHLTVRAASGLPEALGQEKPLERCPLDEEALLGGGPIVVPDTRADPRAGDLPRDYRSVLCVPLVHGMTPLGTIHVCAAAPGRFAEEEAARLSPLADLGAAAIAAVREVAALGALEGSKPHFIRVATHELRSPVTAAQSLVRGVLKGYAGEMTDRQAEIFGRISRKLDLLEHLVNDLLDLAAGKAAVPEEETAVVLNSSVGRAVLLLMPRAEEKGVELVHRACCEELVVRGSEEGLDRIFVNLVGNAIKYTPPGGRVEVTLRPASADEIEVKVVDTGIGIPEEAMPHLFEEFYRAPNAKALDEVGTGLGLTIVKDLVDRYGGRIEVDSTLGEGSTFRVSFPMLKEW